LLGLKRSFEEMERLEALQMDILKGIQELKEDKILELTVSRVTTGQFAEILKEHGLKRKTLECSIPPATKDITPFIWSASTKEDSHANGYIQWLNDNIGLPEDVQFYCTSSKKDLLTTSMASTRYKLKGTTDVAIVKKAYVNDANYVAGFLVCIEGKKQVQDKDSIRAILKLISANLSVVSVVTDFQDIWRLFWLEPGYLVGCTFSELRKGVAFLEAIVREAESTLPASEDKPYRRRCNFFDAIRKNVGLDVSPVGFTSADQVRVFQKAKIDTMDVFPRRDVADMSDFFDDMTDEEKEEWQRKQALEFARNIYRLQDAFLNLTTDATNANDDREMDNDDAETAYEIKKLLTTKEKEKGLNVWSNGKLAVSLEFRNTQLDLKDAEDDFESSQAERDSTLSSLAET
ncbi:hypothetical protein BGZ49_000909, partial [Haplosporangium sp. Z 27]